MRVLLSWLLYPLIVGGGMAAGILLLDAGHPEALVVGGLGVAAMVTVAILERVHPHVPAWNRSRGDLLPDAMHMAVSSVGMSQLVNVTLLAALAGVAPWFAGATGITVWPGGWPLLAQLALALVVGELGQYWAHRLLHERPLLWRIHSVHHSAERLYWLNGSRNHPFDVLWQYSWLTVPMVVLGAGADVLALMALVPALGTPLQHSNVAVRHGLLNYVVSSAELHRWHHAPGVAGNVNYGGNLVLWDLVFGSFHRPRDRDCTEVGLADLPDFPRRYRDHLLVPLRWPPSSVHR